MARYKITMEVEMDPADISYCGVPYIKNMMSEAFAYAKIWFNRDSHERKLLGSFAKLKAVTVEEIT